MPKPLTCPRCAARVPYRRWFENPTKLELTLVCRACGLPMMPTLVDLALLVVLGSVAYLAAFGMAFGSLSRVEMTSPWFLALSIAVIGTVTAVGAVIAPLWMRMRRAVGEEDDATRCWSCRYDARNDPGGCCPECGAELGYSTEETDATRRG